MRLTVKVQLLEGGVVPERLRKRPGPLCPDELVCEGPPTQTHTEPYQCKSGSPEEEPRFRETFPRPHVQGLREQRLGEPREQCRIIGWWGGMRLTSKVQLQEG